MAKAIEILFLLIVGIVLITISTIGSFEVAKYFLNDTADQTLLAGILVSFCLVPMWWRRRK